MLFRRIFVAAVVLPLALCAAEFKPRTAGTVERLQADLKFLASDECEGRGPGTQGIDLAADRIMNTFKEAGLQGAMPDGSYFQPFEIRGPAKVAKPLVLVTSEATIHANVRDGFQPFEKGGDGQISGEVVFVGYGITAPDQDYDDYAGLDVTGKIVLMLRRLPHYANQDKPFAADDVVRKLASVDNKLDNAKQHKVAGVIMVNDSTAAIENNDDLNGLANILRSAAKIPTVAVKRHLAASLIRSAFGKSLSELEEQIDKNLKPISQALAGCTAEFAVEHTQVGIKNVVGVLPGAGPLADETVIIGAHYDHLGYGGTNSLSPAQREIHHGADDNASGTTSLLELARRFGAIKNRQGRRLVFMAFTGEEIALLGSAHYCKNPIFPLDKTVAMVNMDMVGRLREDKDTHKDKLDVGGTGTAKQFDTMIDNLAQKYDISAKKSSGGMGPSDHQSFFMKELPVLFLFTGVHADYHRPSDTWDKINYEGMARIVDMSEEIVSQIAVMNPKPEFVNDAGVFSPFGGTPRAGGPRLGVMPDYNFSGEGMRVDGVTSGGAAGKGGMKAGDRIVEIDGKPVRNVTTYMEVMEKVKPGQEISVTVLRGKDATEEKITLKVTPTRPRQ
ncbi:MAG: M28 family peptidase [Gemmataceae bacterium]